MGTSILGQNVPGQVWYERQGLDVIVWVAASLLLLWQLATGNNTFSSSGTLVALGVMLVCTVLLIRAIPNPIPATASSTRTRRGLLLLTATGAFVLLVLLVVLLGKFAMFTLPVMGLGALVWLRPSFTRAQLLYAVALALVAGIAGLGAGWITFISPVQWGILQLFLVTTGLLAGWGLFKHTGLLASGVGKSRFLSQGFASATRGFLLGILVAMPWALAAVVMGGASNAKNAWITDWWHPLAAIEPGIAEEAWGRILLVPLLFLFLRRFGSPRTAFTVALVVIGYWFAYLHTAGDPNLMNVLVSTLIIGTLTALPLSYLCLYRDLETAIGFHFWVDFFQFACTLFLLN